MADYTQLKQAVSDVIKANGNEEITGDLLQSVLLSVISTVGKYALYVGMATPATAPGVEDGNVFYLASTPGVYPNFGGYNLELGTLVVFKNTTLGWVVEVVLNGFKPDGLVVEGDERAVSGDEVFKSLPEYIESKNRFNPEDIQFGKYVSTNSGLVQSGIDWDCSGYIPVEPGNYYISGNKNRTGVGFYNSSKAPLRYANVNIGVITVQEGESFVVFNLKSNVSGGYSNIQFEAGSSATTYEPYSDRLIKKESVQGLVTVETMATQSSEITSEIEKEANSSNLINPNAMQYEVVLVSGGGTASGTIVADQYNTTEFIRVEPSTFYQGLRLDSSNIFRFTAFYSQPNEASYVSQITVAHDSFTTPGNGYYLRTSIYNENHGSTLVGDMANVGLFKGVSPVWSYFGIDLKIKQPISTSQKKNNSIATIEDVKNLIGDVTETNGFTYSIAGGIINLTYNDGIISGLVNENRGYDGNNMFNFRQTTFNAVTVGSTDDVAPMHILSFTMGANHGYNQNIATINEHGLTNLDIGTEFLKGGVKFYLIRIIDLNTVAFLSENTGTQGNPVFTILSTGSITRGVQSFNITARSTAQLYPSIGELNKKIVVGEKEFDVTENISGKTKSIDVAENYVIYDPTTVLNNLILRAGQPQEPTMIGEPNVLVNNIYRFVESSTCIVYSNVQFLKAVAFNDLMIAQAVIIGSNNGTTQYYVPNSNPLNGSVDLRKPTGITWSASIPATYVVNANQPDPLNPPNRVIQYRGNVGFMMCYVLTRGQGKNIADYTNRTFEIRNNTGKVYPHPVEGSKVGVTTNTKSIYSVAMARVYTNLAKTRIGNRLSVFKFNVDDETHVYIDYSGTMIDKVNLDDILLNGKKIEVLESKNAVLKNTIYNQGFVVDATYIEGETCYIVLIIK